MMVRKEVELPGGSMARSPRSSMGVKTVIIRL